MAGASARIAAFGAHFACAALSDAQRHQAYRALLDTIACAIAGREDEAPRLATGYQRGLASMGHATVWATGETMHPECASFINGVAAHVLDYDDVMTPMRGHISVAMVPALTALAQHTGADGVQVTQPRVLLVSVPYALKAGDAATLGGLPASAFVLNADALASRVSDNEIGRAHV